MYQCLDLVVVRQSVIGLYSGSIKREVEPQLFQISSVSCHRILNGTPVSCYIKGLFSCLNFSVNVLSYANGNCPRKC